MFSSITSLFGLFGYSNEPKATVIVGVVIDQPHDSTSQPEIYSQKEMTNQYTVLQPEINSQEAIINQLMLVLQGPYHKTLYHTADIKNKSMYVSFYVGKNLIDAIDNECHKFAVHYFAHQLANDPTIINNENKWDELFMKIEECIRKSQQEIIRCCQAVAIGYCEEAGMPKCTAKIFQLGDPIYFGDPNKYSKPSDYLIHLLLIAQERMPYFIEMHNSDAKALSDLELVGKKPVEGITLKLSVFLKDKIKKIAVD